MKFVLVLGFILLSRSAAMADHLNYGFSAETGVQVIIAGSQVVPGLTDSGQCRILLPNSGCDWNGSVGSGLGVAAIDYYPNSTAHITVNSSAAAGPGVLRMDLSIYRETLTFQTDASVQIAGSAGAFADFFDVIRNNSTFNEIIAVHDRISVFGTDSCNGVCSITTFFRVTPDLGVPFIVNLENLVTFALAPGQTTEIYGFARGSIALPSNSVIPGPNEPRFPDYASDFYALDLSHTVNFYLDVLTPGGSIESGSGHNYSSAVLDSSPVVPEPSTITLMALGLFTIVVVRGVRKRPPDKEH